MRRVDSLRCSLWGRTFGSPVMLASGTAGFGLELHRMGCLEGVAAVVSKGTTLRPRAGNPPPRVWETRMGLLNSIGLANPGVHHIVREVLPEADSLPCPVIVNVSGDTEEEFAEVVSLLEGSPVPFGYEVNVSCPNVARGGMSFGADPLVVERVSALVRSASSRPFSVKLTPNAGDMAETAMAACAGGADAITVCNTFLGMKVDWRTGRPAMRRGVAGYTSPALLPLVVASVHAVSEAVGVPVLASGGVSRAEDLLELMAAGAEMVQVGSLVLRRPCAAGELLRDAGELLR
ncbi:MAG: dihydroorotate dehydrogenase [Candidatus Fermentibacteraceae bacterium]